MKEGIFILKKSLFFTITIVALLLIFEFLGVINFIPNTEYHSMTTSGLIVDKEIDKERNHYIQLNIFSKKNDEFEQVKISVPSENIWNLIEVDRTYFVVYEWKNNAIPLLLQIEINDKFQDKFEKNLH